MTSGVFNPGSQGIPKASHVPGTFYVTNQDCCWITMDQEINEDGDILFFSNAFFPFPPGPIPQFSNISYARKNSDGVWEEPPEAVEIMKAVNSVVDPKQLRYSPSSFGKGALELYFTVRVSEPVISGLFVAKRNSPDEPFGEPERIFLPYYTNQYLEPEAPTISKDGKVIIFNRMDCNYKTGCFAVNLYKLNRINPE
jgi:hypothetical protein